jgi:hypothetical protein
MIYLQKGQVSIEYLLITLSVITVLSLIILQATTLYSKNIIQIDNKALKNTYEKIQSSIDICYLLDNYYIEIETSPEKDWFFERINDNKFILKNKHKEHTIESLDKIKTNIKIINGTISIKKENKMITIEQK